jgi:hypothetical protein
LPDLKLGPFVLGVLGVWRVTHLLHAEDGPGDVVVALRRAAGRGRWGAALDCFYCLSVWVAAPFACWLTDRWGERVLCWLALSGAACLLERPRATPVPYQEEPPTRGDP